MAKGAWGIGRLPSADVLAHGRDNNFKLIRMVAASCVIISHSLPLTLGKGTSEPLHSWIAPLDLGKASVRVFFALSGFFILKSFDTRRSTLAFALARVARIVPALMLVWFVTSLMAASGVSFANNPFPNAVNGSLWTLSYEVAFYYALALAGFCQLYGDRRFAALLVGLIVIYAAVKFDRLRLDHDFANLGLPFVSGMAIYQYRKRIPLAWPIALVLFLMAWLCPADPTWSIALSYAAFWLGSTAAQLRVYNRLGDYSYGTYIFAWPIQQVIELLFPGIGPVAMILIALPTVWSLGALSWHLVESPALDRAHALTMSHDELAPFISGA